MRNGFFRIFLISLDFIGLLTLNPGFGMAEKDGFG